MGVYEINRDLYSVQLNTINKKYNSISILRLGAIVFFLGCMYYYIKNGEAVFIVLSVLFFGIFIVLMRFHSKLVFQKQIKQALIQINENEIDSITPIFKNQLTEILFDDIVNELNEQSLHYKDAIKELAKDKPILAFEISHHASYLQIATENLDRFISNFKTEITEENQIEFEKIIRDILKENLLKDFSARDCKYYF